MNDSTRLYQIGLHTSAVQKNTVQVRAKNLRDSNKGIFFIVFKQDLISYFYLFIYRRIYPPITRMQLYAKRAH